MVLLSRLHAVQQEFPDFPVEVTGGQVFAGSCGGRDRAAVEIHQHIKEVLSPLHCRVSEPRNVEPAGPQVVQLHGGQTHKGTQHGPVPAMPDEQRKGTQQGAQHGRTARHHRHSLLQQQRAPQMHDGPAKDAHKGRQGRVDERNAGVPLRHAHGHGGGGGCLDGCCAGGLQIEEDGQQVQCIIGVGKQLSKQESNFLVHLGPEIGYF
mmetsp:Transcript_29519/g.74286  ORF Transcript_29519/g.74286 Transcript_29519/m.74286 type:complete len:207 (+) Transcript_29519:141-761(+)